MTWIILLFGIGILMLMAEVLVPGGILGIIGGLLILAGCTVAFWQFGGGGGLLAVASALAVGGVAFFIEFKVLPKTRIGQRSFLTREITAVSRAVDESARNLIGKSAEAETMLSPSGYVNVDGRRYEAFCPDGQVPARTPLIITGADSFRLIVSPRTTTSPTKPPPHHA